MSAVEQFQAATENLATATQYAVRAIYLRLVSKEISAEDATLLIAAEVNRANAQAVSLGDVYLAAQIEELTGQAVPTVGVLPVDGSDRLLKAAQTILTDTKPRLKPLSSDDVKATITGAGLDPEDWNVSKITKLLNASIRELAQDRADPHPIYSGEDFIELVNENPARRSAPQLNSDDYTNVPDVWQAEDDGGSVERLERLARAEPLESAQKAAYAAMQEQDLVEGWVRQMDANPCQLCRWWWRDGRVWPKVHRFQQHKGCNCQPRVVLAQSIKSTQYSRQVERSFQ